MSIISEVITCTFSRFIVTCKLLESLLAGIDECCMFFNCNIRALIRVSNCLYHVFPTNKNQSVQFSTLLLY